VSISVLAPRFTALDARNDSSGLQLLFMRAMAAASEIAVAVCSVAGVVGGAFIVFWVGDGFEEAVPALWILLLGLSLALIQNPGISLLYALNRHRFYALINLVEGLVNLGLSIVLVSLLGLKGIALGITIPLLLNKVLVMPRYVGKMLGVSQRRYWSAMLPALLAGMISVAMIVFLGLHEPLSWPPILDILGRGGLTGLLYLALSIPLSRWIRGALPATVEMALNAVGGMRRKYDQRMV
jgi:O-antigen/teichoic acid export membrane protein